MQTVPEVLHVKWVILYFICGQVFFILGLVAGLRSRRRRSRLELANALTWLAAFGIAQGLNEWGYIFIPLQALHLPHPAVALMHLTHLLLLVASSFCLFQFGVELVLPALPHSRWPRVVPGAAVILWGILVFIIGSSIIPFETFIAAGNAWSRYVLVFPGSILACAGLVYQGRIVRRMDLPRITAYLRGAAAAFLFYALVGGLIVPKSSFFPASSLNYEVVLETLGVPVQVFRSLCGLAMIYFVARSLEVFRIETERFIEEMKQARLQAVDRERIGRDLHDGVIQSIYAAGLWLEEALYLVPLTASQAHKKIRAAMERLNQTIQEIRTYIFDLREAEKSRELEEVLEDMVYDLRLDTLLEVDLRVDGTRSWTLSGEQITHLTQIAREALSNVVRHANAQHVTVGLNYERDSACLIVADDGVGMQVPPADTGGKGHQGILYMQERTRILGGEFFHESAPGQGTSIKVVVPRRQ